MDDPFSTAPNPGSNLTDISRTAKHGSYAHFPGTGPAGRYCERCFLFRPAEKKRGWGLCAKFTELMGFKGTQIRAATACCKYFDPTPRRGK